MIKEEKFSKKIAEKRILIAPLDWGLGHSARCIPIIYELLAKNCTVLIAAQGASKDLLQQEFPKLPFLSLFGYNIRYTKKKIWLPVKILAQLPCLIRSVYQEHRWLKKIAAQYAIDAVISDNRFGLFHPTIPCVFITHQLKIKAGNSIIEKLLQKINYYFINKYNICWVPDNAGEVNLAGELSHAKILPKTSIQYIGPLSRFKKKTEEIKYDLMIILSGPEPQRSILEELLLEQLKEFTGSVLFVRGLPDNNKAIPAHIHKKIEIKNHLGVALLNKAIQQSRLIISRSGYTTVMDLIILQQKAILIPTPGQTEQEYLAEYLMNKRYFYSVKQSEFLLQHVLEKVKSFPFITASFNQNEYKQPVNSFISSIA